MFSIIDRDLAGEMVEQACKIALSHGISTRNNALLEKAKKTKVLLVKNQRIYPSKEILNSLLKHIKQNVVPTGDICGNHHGWTDMIINKGNDLVIKLTDLPYQYCNHHIRQITPLLRKQVIEGTKLLHTLSKGKNIKGYSCGVPQDTSSQLRALEQYLIGFRYNQNGGGTIQPIPQELETEFSKIRFIAEDWQNPDQRDLMLFSPSPMILDSDDLYLCFKKGISINSFMVGSMPLMGMTGPVDPIGVYLLGIAEVIGAAAILHAILPNARAYVYPHPQAMSLQTGQMAFGTIEHARLEMLKFEIMDVLGLSYYNLKDIMTSAQMPGSMAQGDKALGFFTGLMTGYKAFNLMPLSTDQVWSPVQALLDIENLQNAWKAIKPITATGSVEAANHTINEVLDQGCLFAEASDTLMNMYKNYDMEMIHNRFYSSETWTGSGSPDELRIFEDKTYELVGSWDYRPPQNKLEKIVDIYTNLCKKYNIEPLNLD